MEYDLKKLRKGFCPKPTALKDPNGVLKPPEQRAELFADHYSNQLWTIPPPPNIVHMPRTPIVNHPPPINLNPFTLQELESVLHKIKKQKSTWT